MRYKSHYNVLGQSHLKSEGLRKARSYCIWYNLFRILFLENTFFFQFGSFIVSNVHYSSCYQERNSDRKRSLTELDTCNHENLKVGLNQFKVTLIFSHFWLKKKKSLLA